MGMVVKVSVPLSPEWREGDWASPPNPLPAVGGTAINAIGLEIVRSRGCQDFNVNEDRSKPHRGWL
jgi:hypothetical protein